MTKPHRPKGDARARRPLLGRRRGRRLRPGLQALVETLLPRLTVDVPPGGGHLDPQVLFAPLTAGTRRPIWLEIGFGAGEHLAWQARSQPDVGFIGAEVFLNGVAQLLRRIDENGLANVRIFPGDGRDLLEALAAASIDRVFILFPDPWPKKRHQKRRLIQRDTLDQLARIMGESVELRLATDDMGYARWMLEHLTAHPDFTWLAEGPADWRTPPSDWPATRYQAKAQAQGARPVYLRFARREGP